MNTYILAKGNFGDCRSYLYDCDHVAQKFAITTEPSKTSHPGVFLSYLNSYSLWKVFPGYFNSQ